MNKYMTDTVTSEVKDTIDKAFGLEMQRTATAFYFFDDPPWVSLLKLLRPAWRSPAAAQIGGPVLNAA